MASALSRAGSRELDAATAIADIHRQLEPTDAAFVLLFVSPQYARSEIAAALRRHFGGTPVFGCTTAGEITPSGYISGGMAAISFPKEEFLVASVVFDRLREFRIADAVERTRAAMVRLEILSGQGAGREMPNTLGLMLVDGLSVREEQLVSAVGNTLSGIPLVGGSAGDALSFRQSFVLHEGEFLTDAGILLLIKTRRRISVFKTEHFVPTRRKMVVTGADLERRRVYEINAEPAALEYARLVGLAGEPLTPRIFAQHPVVVRVGGQYHVRAIQSVNPDNSLTFFCAIDEGLVLTVAEGVDMLENLNQLLERLDLAVGRPDLIIGFDCVLRNIELEQRQLKGAVSKLFMDHQVVGFCTYGEQYMSMHVNQTLTGVAIGPA